MKKFLLLLAGLGLLLPSCKKEQSTYANLDVNGYGPMMFVSGDAISIYGSGFDPDPDNNTVLFEGVAGEVATASANRLQVIVPLLANSGKITVLVHGKTVVSNLPYTLLNLVSASSSAGSTILSADKKYLLRGNVYLTGKLIIQAGTVIYGEKATHGSLSVQDIDFEGTAANPIIFTSDQPAGSRLPGDWGGITVSQNYSSVTNNYLSNGVMSYVRVEFGNGVSLNMDANNSYNNIQVSYSSGNGFNLSQTSNTGLNSGDALANYLVAFACQGTDFYFDGLNLNVQYALGLKDPYAANGIGQGVGLGAAVNVRLSNFTLIGYNPSARNILGITAGFPVNPNAGRGVQIGCNALNTSNQYVQHSEQFAMYNSVIAGSWLAGVSLFGQGDYQGSPWDDYEGNGAYLVSLQSNYITGTAPAAFPFRGGTFAREDYVQNTDGFENTQGDPKVALFASYNDTTKMLDFNQKKDDLGITGLADYHNLNHPVLLPAVGSILLTTAHFPGGSPVDNPIFNKDVKFVGAFGTQDWTTPWCNFNPQFTNY